MDVYEILYKSGFDYRRGMGIFLFDTVFRPALGPSHSPVRWVPGALSLGGKADGAWTWPFISI